MPLLAFAVLAVFTALGAYRAADEGRLREAAHALAATVDAHLGNHLAALRTLASSRLLDGPLDADAFAMRSRAVGEDFAGWVVLLGPPPSHPVLTLSNEADQTKLPAQLPAENRRALDGLLDAVFAQGRAGVSDRFQDSVVQREIVTAMVPVTRVGQPPRALALSFEPTALRSLLAQHDLPAGVVAAIHDGNLHLLARSDDPVRGDIWRAAPDWLPTATAGQRRAVVVGSGGSGQDNVYAVERLTIAAGWTVTVAEPLAAQRASAWDAIRWLLASGAVLALGMAVAAWVLNREALRAAHREATALRAGRAEVERLHAALPALIYLREVAADGGSRLLYRGGDIETVTGWPADTFAGVDSLRPWVDLEGADYHVFMASVLRDGGATVEYRLRQPDGSWRWMRSRGRRLMRRPDDGGEVVGYILDITTERAAETRALTAARLASLGEMAAGLAHEIKQPLQSISLAAEIAQLAIRRHDTAEAERRLDRIVEQTQRSADLLDRLRRFARGAEGATTLEDVPLAAVVEGTLSLVSSVLRDASIVVEVALGDPPPVVRGQAVLLEQVLSNLLLNARDALATRPAGAPRRISIAATPGPDGMVQLTVGDTGGGIAPEVMARLFEPFVTTKGPDKGTGLGLSICHGLVKGMGGSIEARNDDTGAVFTIRLHAA